MLPSFTSDVKVLEDMVRSRWMLGGKVMESPPSTPPSDDLTIARELSFSGSGSQRNEPDKPKVTWKGTAARPTAASKAWDVTQPKEEVKRPTVSRERKEEAINKMHAWSAKGSADLNRKVYNAVLRRERTGLYTNGAIRMPTRAWGSRMKVSVLQALVEPKEGGDKMFDLPLDEGKKVAWQDVNPVDVHTARRETDKSLYFVPDPAQEDPAQLVQVIKPQALISAEEYNRISRSTVAFKGKAPEPPPEPQSPKRLAQISVEDYNRIARGTAASRGKLREGSASPR